MNTKRLMELLDHRILPHEAVAEVASAGEMGLQVVLSFIRAGNATDLRLVNALVLVVKARYLGDPAEVFNVLLNAAVHPSHRVRSSAVGLVLNLLHREHEVRPTPREIPREADVITYLERALTLGLEPVASSRVRAFLHEHAAAE